MDTEKARHGVDVLEQLLSKYNSKTVDYQLYQQYIKQESDFDSKTGQFGVK